MPRISGRRTVESSRSYVLDAAIFNRLRLKPGVRASGTIRFGEFPVEIAIDTTDAWRPHLELSHASRDWYEDDQIVRYCVDLDMTVPHFGGRRWWFKCPRTDRRVAKLYLPLGGWEFLSREAHGLGYFSQRLSRRDRRVRKAHRTHVALGGDGNLLRPPPKPKGMWRKSYERRVAALQRATAWHVGRPRCMRRCFKP